MDSFGVHSPDHILIIWEDLGAGAPTLLAWNSRLSATGIVDERVAPVHLSAPCSSEARSAGSMKRCVKAWQKEDLMGVDGPVKEGPRRG